MARIIEVTESMHAIEQGGGAVHIPEGEYLLEISRIMPCNEKQWEDTEKNPFMAIRTTIVDGPVKSRPFSEILTWAPEGQFRMGRFLAGCGVGRPKVGQKFDYATFTRFAEALTGALAGKKIGVMIGDNSYNGKVTSQVVEFYPEADYEGRKGSLQVGQPTPTGSNGIAASPAASEDALSAFEASLGDLLPEPTGV